MMKDIVYVAVNRRKQRKQVGPREGVVDLTVWEKTLLREK
jgi:hypothetical protein